MAHATKRKNICTARVSDDFQGFFAPTLSLPLATLRPSLFFGRIIKGHKVIAVSVNRDTRPRSTWLLCQKFLPGRSEGVGWGGECNAGDGTLVTKFPSWLLVCQQLRRHWNKKLGNKPRHSTTQLYTTLPCTALDSTQHWPTRWGINLKLRAAANMPHTHTSAHCFMLQQLKGRMNKREGEESEREREREREQVLKLCRQLVDEVWCLVGSSFHTCAWIVFFMAYTHQHTLPSNIKMANWRWHMPKMVSWRGNAVGGWNSVILLYGGQFTTPLFVIEKFLLLLTANGNEILSCEGKIKYNKT